MRIKIKGMGSKRSFFIFTGFFCLLILLLANCNVVMILGESNQVSNQSPPKNLEIKDKITNGYILTNSTINLSIPTPENDYQVKLFLTPHTFNYSKTNSDGSDIRFTDSSGSPLNYWIQSWDPVGTSIIWIEVPQAGTTYFTMSYGNPNAISESNGDNTFIFFDDFSGSTINSSRWNVENDNYSTASINSGMAVLNVNTPDNHADAAMVGFSDAWIDHGNTYGIKEWDSITFGASYSQGDAVLTEIRGVTPSTITPNTFPIKQWFIGQIRWLNDSYVEFDNGTNIIEHSTGIPSGLLPVEMLVPDMDAGPGTWFGSALDSINSFAQEGNGLNFRAYYDYGIDSPVTLKVDWIFVRNINSIEPVPYFSNIIGEKPSVPQNLFSTIVDNHIVLSWSKPSNNGGLQITKYNVYRSLTSGSGYNLIGTTPTTSFNDTSLTNGVIYYYIVRAVNLAGESANSNEVTSNPPKLTTTPSTTTTQNSPTITITAVPTTSIYLPAVIFAFVLAIIIEKKVKYNK